MRRAALLTVAAATALIVALLGCGAEFPMPTEIRGTYSADKQYHMDLTWTNMSGIADILFIQGSGAQLFLLFTEGGDQGRGRVEGYALRATPPTPRPFNYKFMNMIAPVALCAGPDRVFVLDQGDTCVARTNPETGTCSPAPDDTTNPGRWDYRITDLSKYWRVREYGLVGGDTLSTFTDTSIASVKGIAADASGRIYVAGTVFLFAPNSGNAGTNRTFGFRVYRYRPRQGNEPVDLYLPGTDRWVRDRTWEVEEGSGIGSLFDPRGLYWTGGSTPGGPGVFAADFGKNWAQKLSDVTSSQGEYAIDAGQDTTLNGPLDVTVDRQGYSYIADTGNRRVLRFDPSGQFVQKINIELDSDGHALIEPVAVAADDSLVYVADRGAGRVVRYRRRD